MSDDTQRNRPYDPEEDEPQDDQATPSRLDRLMGAKDQSDKEAARWSEIEDLGMPVPSQDQSNDLTQPYHRPEASTQDGDTPVGQDTPTSQALPPAESRPAYPPPPPPPSPYPPHPTDRPIQPPSGVPFPHPTDRPLTPPSSSAPPPGTGTPRRADTLPEPPRPDRMDADDLRRGVKQPGGMQHQRYQPPEVNTDDVRLDANGMPLPRRVSQEDLDATIVGQSAYRDDAVGSYDQTVPQGYERPEYVDQPNYYEQQPAAPTGGRAGGYGDYVPPVPPAARPQRRRARRGGFKFSWSAVGRLTVLALIFGLVALMLGGGASAIYYAQETAPSFENINTIQDLQKKAFQFNTTRIYDKDKKNLLYQINDPNGGFRTYKTLDEISPWVIVGTVSTEERLFFTNPGFSIPAIMRAVYMGVSEGRAIAGTSTITQQLTRALLLPEEERTQRSYRRKVKEIFLAAELGRRFTKKQILELYLNQIYYGNMAYGIEAAAQTYFHKSAKDLNLAEASFLVGLPQSPAVYDPVNNLEGAVSRQADVLTLMKKAGCLETGDTDIQLPCVTQEELDKATPEIQSIAQTKFEAPAIQAKYPHWVVYIQKQLEDELGQNVIYSSGYDVITTLDPRIQDAAQTAVDINLSGLVDRNVHNASVIVIDVHTGAILAMIGSRDFNDESIDGQVNVALTPQQPGSSIKPFTYMAAFRKGWTPATVLWDVPIVYDIPGYGQYPPVDYDGKFRGPVSVRYAIANSLNVPAVETLDFVGVPALLQVLNDVGVTSLGDPSNPKQYGLSLTLGAGEVYLLDWANAYATLARGGKYLPTYGIQSIELNGKPIAGYPHEVPEAKQVLDPDQTYLLTTILSDTQARIPSFGANSVISPPYPAAAKTGTTNDFRDNWTMGYTTQIATGVWVGNSDNSEMINVTGVTGAGPIWRAVMDEGNTLFPAQPFPKPPSIDMQTVCADDGAIPSQYCTEHSDVYQEIFGPKNRPPAADQGLYRQLKIDSFTGLIANENCQDYTEDKFFVTLPNPSQMIDIRQTDVNWLLNTDEGKAWMTRRGLPTDRFEQAPTEGCKPDSPKPDIKIDFPVSGQSYNGKIKVQGTVDAPNFAYYTVDFGLAEDPEGWGVLQEQTNQPVHGGKLGQIDLDAFDPGPMTIRVTVYDTAGHHAERRVTFQMKKSTPTPGPTDTPAPTATNTPPATPTVATPTPTTEAITPTVEGITPTP